MLTRARCHCFICASYVRRDADLSSLRAKPNSLPPVESPRRSTGGRLIEKARHSLAGGHPNKYKKV
jgi:hypothetical protein